MSKAKESEFEKPAPIIDDEDEATVAAIDEGIRDAKAGRTVPLDKVRKLLPKWITASSLSPAISHSSTLFCTFLHSQKTQPPCFQSFPHSASKNTTTRGIPTPLRGPK